MLPQWAQTLGWLMAVVSVAVIPVWMVYEMIKSYKNPDHDGLSFGRVSLELFFQYYIMNRYIVDNSPDISKYCGSS